MGQRQTLGAAAGGWTIVAAAFAATAGYSVATAGEITQGSGSALGLTVLCIALAAMFWGQKTKA